MSHPSTFGRRLKQLRQEHGLTQDTLAERIGCATQTIRKIEGGQRRPSYQIAVKLADELGIAHQDRADFVRCSRDESSEQQSTRSPQAVSDAPPLCTARPPSNLPVPLTRLIGREHELARTRELVLQDHVRLLTLVGAGGAGKTRLVVEAAAGLHEHFLDGVVFVNLVPIRDPELLIPTIADAVGVGEEGGRSRLERLQERLKTKRLLLVLDNFEHVSAAADLLVSLLSCCPGITALVTSREVLRVRGEHVLTVLPFRVPKDAQGAADLLARYPAVQLFVERAAAAKPGFSLTDQNASAVAELCLRLDGLPLAIELAAARSALFSPEAMLARLGSRLTLLTGGPRDVPLRQQTLRGTIDWSYGLLTESEQAFFRRLCVFIGGCTLDAIAAVCGSVGALELENVESLASLVGKSLLWQDTALCDEPRFLMLETIREFGLEQLERSGEAEAVHSAHADYYLRLVERAQPHLWGRAQAHWLDRLEQEHDNLRMALTWHVAAEDCAPALCMAGRLWRFWNIRGHWTEGLQWLEQALSRLPGGAPAQRWLALHGAGNLSLDLGEYETAKRYYEESLAVTQLIDHQRGVANSLLNLSLVASYQGELQQALDLQERALALHRTLGNTIGVALVLHNLASILVQQGDHDRAARLANESLACYRELHDCRGIAWALHDLALVAHRSGAYDRARVLFEESRAIYAELGAKNDLAWVVNDLGALLDDCAEHELAGALYEQSLRLASELGDRRCQAAALDNLGRHAHRVGDHELGLSLCRKSLSLRRDLGDRRGIALALESLSQMAPRRPLCPRAARQFQAV
jgi:predicted ATPase/transcriptional regulator with XRE-family HTH domain